MSHALRRAVRDLGPRGDCLFRGGLHGEGRPMTERTFEHASALYDGMTWQSRGRVLSHFDDLLAMSYDEDVRKVFILAVGAEFDAIERRMLLAKQGNGSA
jgi:hypothetical protein